MRNKNEPCRNFQRGSCQYGERCKFLHVTQQPQKLSSFGYGMQNSSQQQQKPNPFGFGQTRAPVDTGFKQNQFKLSDNKWTRSSTPTGNAPNKSDNQVPSANHKCTDGVESCKRQIAEDFQNERPLWKLTCYGHNKTEPCDIVGDVSYEELRAIAYDEAKRGISLQSIVERERNLFNSKLAEFESLLHKPYVTPLNHAPGNKSSFPGTNSPSILPSAQNSHPPSLSSFSQFGSSLNLGFGARPSNPPNNAFGQPVQFSNSQGKSGAFGIANFSSTTTNFPLTTTSFPSTTTNFTSTTTNFPSTTTNFPSTSPAAYGGAFGSQLPSQAFGNSTVTGFNNSNITNTGSNLFTSPAILTKPPSTDAGGQIVSDAQLVNKLQQENSSVDASIWLKEQWVPGEIPEVAPPDAAVQ